MSETNVQHHTTHVKNEINNLVQHLREDVSKVADPRAKALFEVSAEVLGGLHKAFDDYEKKNEPAWN